MEETKIVKCADCGGDGIDTCHNPDHGFLGMIGSVVGANESACPGCGHSHDHKRYEYIEGKRKPKPCETCKGTGTMSYSEMIAYCDDFVPEDERDDIIQHCIE